MHRRAFVRLAGASLLGLTLADRLRAQPEKPFTLSYYGLAYFVLTTPGGKRIAFNPHGYADFSPPAVQADIICLSHRERFLSNPELIENYKAARVLEGVKAPVKNRPGEFQPIDEKIGGI
ncbi:MAG: MBL fold metallo-hydrolase, partial [Gemmataceae bacterium]